MITPQGISYCATADNRGFSIIEVIFALSIFAIGILAVSTLAISSVNSNASARRITDATALAEDRLEKLAAMPYDDIVSDQEMVGAYQITWVVVEDDIIVKTKSIAVTVNIPNGWTDTNVTIRHLISKNS
jgi:prepilin-type N-terminal cleavage/methylation domain-containing protein